MGVGVTTSIESSALSNEGCSWNSWKLVKFVPFVRGCLLDDRHERRSLRKEVVADVC
jgi:hypothetical protein